MEEPSNTEYRGALARIYSDRGHAQMQLSQHLAAEASFQQARRLFEELVEEAPTDPVRLRGRAAVLENQALLYRATDRRAEAGAIYDALLPLRERLAGESTAPAQRQRELARTLHNLALFHRSGRKPDEARAPLERAVALRRELVRTHPQIDKYQDELAGTLNELALVHLERGRSNLAQEAVQQAITIWERLAGLYPDVLDYQTALLDALDNLAVLQSRVGKPAEAEQTFRDVITRLGKLVAEHTEVPALATRLGGGYCNLANHVKDHGKPKEALAEFERAELTLRAVLAKDENSRQAREFLRNTHWGRAEAFTLLQQHKAALAQWDQALELAGDESRAELSLCRAGTLVRMGDHRRGVAVVGAVSGSETLTGALLYNSACVYSLAAAAASKDETLAAAEREKLADEYARQAVAHLGQAHKQRLFRSQAMREQLRQDPDLAAVRSRDDFKRLLAEIEKS
jgi:tetratricopeptide (TPR) repeat protein